MTSSAGQLLLVVTTNECRCLCVNFIKDSEWTYNILLNPQYQLSTTCLRFIFCVFQYIVKHLYCDVLLAVTRLLKLPFNSLFPEHGQQRWLWQLLTKFFMDWMIQIREISNSLKLICKINQSHEREFILIPTKLIVLLFFHWYKITPLAPKLNVRCTLQKTRI